MSGKLTQEQRANISNLFIRQMKKFERKHIPALYKAMLMQIEDFISDMRKHGIDYAERQIDSTLVNAKVADAIQALYIEGGVFFANETVKNIKQASNRKAHGRLGRNQGWIDEIISYFRTRLLSDAVVPITYTTRQQIRRVLTNGIEAGWGIDELAQQMRSPELTFWRAQLIARTELSKSANVGRRIAANDSEFETQKEWITSGDNRVRDLHSPMDGVVVDMDEDFIVGGEAMNGPGDPRASAENVCNCRCTLAIVPKRDSRGNLIMKN